jgi:acetate kinase
VELRARIVEKLAWLGAKLDPSANAARESRISSQESRIGLYVVPTDEELMIARHTLELISSGRRSAEATKRPM